MSDDRETPWDRAYRLALGRSAASTVIVSFFFIQQYTYTVSRAALRAYSATPASPEASPPYTSGTQVMLSISGRL